MLRSRRRKTSVRPIASYHFCNTWESWCKKCDGRQTLGSALHLSGVCEALSDFHSYAENAVWLFTLLTLALALQKQWRVSILAPWQNSGQKHQTLSQSQRSSSGPQVTVRTITKPVHLRMPFSETLEIINVIKAQPSNKDLF